MAFFGFAAMVPWIQFLRAKCTEDVARGTLGAWAWNCIKTSRETDSSHTGARIKILWTCYQIIAQTSWTLPDVVFPPMIQTAIRWISTLTVFSLDVNLPMNCINPHYNFYHNVIATNVVGPRDHYVKRTRELRKLREK